MTSPITFHLFQFTFNGGRNVIITWRRDVTRTQLPASFTTTTTTVIIIFLLIFYFLFFIFYFLFNYFVAVTAHARRSTSPGQHTTTTTVIIIFLLIFYFLFFIFYFLFNYFVAVTAHARRSTSPGQHVLPAKAVPQLELSRSTPTPRLFDTDNIELDLNEIQPPFYPSKSQLFDQSYANYW